jgi:hypothetical protein
MSGGYRGYIAGTGGVGEYPDLPHQRQRQEQDAREIMQRQVGREIDRLVMACRFCPEEGGEPAVVRLLLPGGDIRPCCLDCLQEHGPTARDVYVIPRAGDTT